MPMIYAGVNWRTAYFIGGGLGLALLVLFLAGIGRGAVESRP